MYIHFKSQIKTMQNTLKKGCLTSMRLTQKGNYMPVLFASSWCSCSAPEGLLREGAF